MQGNKQPGDVDNDNPKKAFEQGDSGEFEQKHPAGNSSDSFTEMEDFSNEDFQSTIPRIDIGVEGLDSMVRGGVPKSSLISVIGSAGVGKTTFGLQFLFEGLINGQKTMFISLEQSDQDIIDTTEELSLDFEPFFDNNSLVVVDIQPLEMVSKLDTIRQELPVLVDNFGAERLVIDSISVIEMMYDDPSTRRTQIFNFLNSLKESGITTMLTSEPSLDSPYNSKHGIVEFMSDVSFLFYFIRDAHDKSKTTRMAMEIQKIRDSKHSREIKPYDITDGGISVYGQANIF